MAGTKLIPGFRFHPTDVELVKYFLKRKILGKRFPFDVIAEIDIYKYAPWDLPYKSLLKTGDLEWYFFCPRGKKYSSGGRMNRATEVGYWKTTGKDRSVEHKNEVVGMIKTLVFHTGRAPKGDRTDWVMHEFRLEDKELANKGIPQDLYVICRVFQKEGPGPRNGAQYGKPFNEEDWDEEDEIDCVESLPIVALSAPDPIQLTTCHNSVANDMHPSTSECIGLTSGSCLSGLMPSCSTHPLATPSSSTQADDAILLMLDTLKEDNTLALNENNRIEPLETTQQDLSSAKEAGAAGKRPEMWWGCLKTIGNEVGVPDKGWVCRKRAGNEEVHNTGQENNAEGTLYFDPNEIFQDLGDLNCLIGLGEDGHAFSCGEKGECTTNEMLSTGDIWGFCDPPDFLELVDLEAPLFWQTKCDGSGSQDE